MQTRPADCVLFFLITLAVLTMQSNGVRAAQLAPHLYKTTIDNGLTALVKETPGTRVATVQIWVKAGSVYEEPREAGITHLIEHMIFKGTPSRGPGKLAEAVESVGGRINAYTSYEYTVYHATLGALHWELALEVLTDAVFNSVFDPLELEREKKVVLEELGMRNDRPEIMLFQELMAHAYRVHPYQRPVIGTFESISSLTREDIIAYLGRHYQPENITVVVVGDVDAQSVLARIREEMGGLARGRYLSPARPQEPSQERPRFFTIQTEVNQPQMALAIPISRFDSPDTPVLDVLAQIVGQGETSRLYRALRDEQQLVLAINGSAFTPRDPGMLEVSAVLDQDKLLPALESTLVELFRLKYSPVSEAELRRAKHSLESDFVFNLERVEGQARVLGSFEFLAGDPREDRYLEKVRTVTREDIIRVARKYLRDSRLTAGFLLPRTSGFSLDDQELDRLIARAETRARQDLSLVAGSYLSGLHRYHLDNGITLLVREDPTVPTVAIRAVFPGGLRAETPASNGAFAFISELLPKGTASMSAREIALAVADMAGSLEGFNGKNTFGLKADFLARFAESGLTLVRDVLISPAFDREEAAKIRPELLAQLKQQEDSLSALAFREFNRLLFDSHPYGLNSLGSESVLRGYTVRALQEIYQEYGRPDKLVLAVAGAVKAGEVYEQVNRLFGGWQVAGELEADSGISEELLTPEAPAQPRILTIDRDKEQLHLIIGFVGTTLASADRFSLEVLDTVLSGQSGRLFTELRDKQSLAYSLSSFSMLGLDTGAFGIYLGTSPEKREQALAGIWQQLRRVRQEEISPAELARAKNILISQYQLGLQTHASQALEIALNETYGLGQDFGDRYIAGINAVDGAAVLAVAQRYILPEHYVLVEVGAGDQAKDNPASAKE